MLVAITASQVRPVTNWPHLTLGLGTLLPERSPTIPAVQMRDPRCRAVRTAWHLARVGRAAFRPHCVSVVMHRLCVSFLGTLAACYLALVIVAQYYRGPPGLASEPRLAPR